MYNYFLNEKIEKQKQDEINQKERDKLVKIKRKSNQ
jgi:hypothetical protein